MIRSSVRRRNASCASADGRHRAPRLVHDVAQGRGDRYRADRAGGRAARNAGRRDSASVWRRPISAAACAYRGRGPNIAAAAARRSGTASSRLAATASRGSRRSISSIPSGRCRRLSPARRWPGPRSRPATSPASTCGSRKADGGTLRIETNIVSGDVDLATLADNVVEFDGGGLGRRLSVYRLPETDWSRSLALEHTVTLPGGADLPVYLRVTQADGHQAWSSPIYLIE